MRRLMAGLTPLCLLAIGGPAMAQPEVAARMAQTALATVRTRR